MYGAPVGPERRPAVRQSGDKGAELGRGRILDHRAGRTLQVPFVAVYRWAVHHLGHIEEAQMQGRLLIR